MKKAFVIIAALVMMSSAQAQEERLARVHAGLKSTYLAGARGDSALIEALSKGDGKKAKQLIAAGADPNSTNDEGFSALHLAITNRLDDISLLLMKQGASVSYDFMGSSPLHLAQISNCEANASGRRVLASLIKHGAKHTQQDLALLELIALVRHNNWRNLDNGYLEAISAGDTEAIKLFLILNPAPNQPIAKEFMPLHYAALAGTPEVIKLLVAAGADVNARNLKGTPVLFMARERPAIQQLLVELGALEEP